jgi:hypothetical protein
MAFDKHSESNEPEFHIQLIFKSGHPSSTESLPMPSSAYIAMGCYSSDEKDRPMITTEEMSFDALRAQVESIKGALDACLGEAKARFAATNA